MWERLKGPQMQTLMFKLSLSYHFRRQPSQVVGWGGMWVQCSAATHSVIRLFQAARVRNVDYRRPVITLIKGQNPDHQASMQLLCTPIMLTLVGCDQYTNAHNMRLAQALGSSRPAPGRNSVAGSSSTDRVNPRGIHTFSLQLSRPELLLRRVKCNNNVLPAPTHLHKSSDDTKLP
jgi:hypothetical protein